MNKYTLTAIALGLSSAFAFTSCETATGTGALIGAGTGAVVASNTGPHGYYRDNSGRTLAGAAIGAGAGALIGAVIDANRAREYGPEPSNGYPFAERSGTPGLVVSPYPPNSLVDVRGIPRGALVRDPSSGRVFRRP